MPEKTIQKVPAIYDFDGNQVSPHSIGPKSGFAELTLRTGHFYSDLPLIADKPASFARSRPHERSKISGRSAARIMHDPAINGAQGYHIGLWASTMRHHGALAQPIMPIMSTFPGTLEQVSLTFNTNQAIKSSTP